MKILFVGQLNNGQTTRMRMDVLRELGGEIIPLNTQQIWSQFSWISRRLQMKAHRGPAIKALNEKVISLAKEYSPDMMWAEKQEYLQPEILERLRGQGLKLLHYTPDPYFSTSWKRTPLMDSCFPIFDYAVTSKTYELDEYTRRCQQVIYMPLGFAEEVHRPVVPYSRTEREAFASDVSFLGGWEPRREKLLDAVTRTGCNLKIWGYSWDHVVDGRWTPRRAVRMGMLAGKEAFKISRNERLAAALKGGEVYGDAYAWALSGAKIGVGFLRTICPDQHTTRTFEIPACGSMMLADRTDEHQEFFQEGKEAEFFSNESELVDKLKFYLKHDDVREKIAIGGYTRCLKSGYSYKNRIKSILSKVPLLNHLESSVSG